MQLRSFALVPTLALVLLATGCDLITDPDRTPQVGIIQGLLEGEPAIEVPLSARVGEAFTVKVTTHWRNTCVRGASTEVAVHGLMATITPYDTPLESRGTGCGQAVTEVVHTAAVRFDVAGAATVAVVGRDWQTGELVEVRYDVTVE